MSVLKGKNKRHLEKVYKFENAEKKLFFFLDGFLECIFREAGRQHLNGLTKTLENAQVKRLTV